MLGFTSGPPVWTIALVKPRLFPPLIDPKFGACGTSGSMSRAVAPVIWNAGSRTVGVQKKENDSVEDAPSPLAVTLKGPERKKIGSTGLLASGVKIIVLADTPEPTKLLAVNTKLTPPIEQVVPSKLFNEVFEQVVAKDAVGKKHKQPRIASPKNLTLKLIHPS